MFKFEDKDMIMNIISRKGDKILIPLYVNIDNRYYKLLEIDERIHSINRNSFKVGFGCVDNMYIKKSFKDTELLQYFQNVKMFNHFNYDTNVTTFYYIFECDNVTVNMLKDLFGEKDIFDEIILYDGLLFNYTSKQVEIYRSKIITKFHDENDKLVNI